MLAPTSISDLDGNFRIHRHISGSVACGKRRAPRNRCILEKVMNGYYSSSTCPQYKEQNMYLSICELPTTFEIK